METGEVQTLAMGASAQVGQLAALPALPQERPVPALTVTTAFRTVEIPLPPGSDLALAVATAKLIVLTDLLRETPEERQKRLEEAERAQKTRQAELLEKLQAAEQRLVEVLAALQAAALMVGQVRERVAAALADLDGEALGALAGRVTREADATLVRNVARAWQAADLAEALVAHPAEVLWDLAERTVEAWRFPTGEVMISA